MNQTSDQEILRLEIIKILKSFPEIKVATLYGSAAQNRQRESSDLDISVAGRTELNFDIKNKISVKLSLTVSKEIDLIDLNRVSGAILRQALCTGIFLLKDSPEILARLMKKMWYHQADMMPLIGRIQKAHIGRFANG